MDQADRLLSRIHTEGIRPVPRWKVRLHRAGWVMLFTLVLLLGTVSVALAVQAVHDHAGRGWLVRQAMTNAAPWVWSTTAALLVWAGIRVFKELPRGWRVRPWHVGLAVGVFCLVGGIALESVDAPIRIHRAIAVRNPEYREAWRERALAEWNDPAAGRLSGRWTSSSAEGNLRDADGFVWHVRWDGNSSLPETPTARLIGRICGPALFCADGWRPAPGFGRKSSER